MSDEEDNWFRELLVHAAGPLRKHLLHSSISPGPQQLHMPFGLQLLYYPLDFALESFSGVFVAQHFSGETSLLCNRLIKTRRQRKRLRRLMNKFPPWENPKNDLLGNKFMLTSKSVSACIDEVARESMMKTLETNEEFVACFSHEALTPIQSMRSALETVIDDETTLKESSTLLKETLQSLDNMRTDLEGVRLLFREKKINTVDEKECTVVDLRELLTRWFDNYQDEIREKNITVYYEPFVGKWTLNAVSAYLEVMIKNLVQNAVKYSFDASSYPDKPGKIIVKYNSKVGVLSLTNYGVPISETEINNREIFKANIRGIESGDRGRMGRGYGLRLVDLIANLHDAKVDVESVIKNPGGLNEFAKITFKVAFNVQKGGL